jgi:Mg2+/Co2+ transporter CorB
MSSEIAPAIFSVICLIIVAAFFTGAESGLTVASRTRLAELEKRGSARAKSALHLLEAPERLMGGLLIGNIFARIAAAAVATAALIKVVGGGGAFISAVGMTIIILIFAEILPKIFAVTSPERTSIAVVHAVRLITAVLAPIALALELIVRAALKLFGANLRDDVQVFSARGELRGAVDLSHEEEALVKEERARLGGILDLKELEVADIMIHRTKMKTLDLGLEPQKLVEAVLESPHTRMPVWRGKPDNIVGILHAKALFKALQEAEGDAAKIDFEKVVVPAWFVPDTRPLEDQLNAFLRRKTHFALVVDEYGEVEGLVTLEDILEEIVGDIKDEFDAVSSGMRKTRDGAYLIDGTVPIRDLNRTFDWQLPDDEATTLAGLVIHEARMIPEAGQAFSFHGFKFEVLKKRKQQITQIKVTKIEQPKEEERPG